MQLQVGVKVLLRNTDGKFLFMRRSQYEERGAGKWDIPGGRIEAGTPLMENLAREIKEETGLVMKGEPRLLTAQDIVWQDRHVVRITYVGEVEGEPTLSKEHSEYAWFSYDELHTVENMDDYVKKLLDQGVIF